jgi:hypothetical protein
MCGKGEDAPSTLKLNCWAAVSGQWSVPNLFLRKQLPRTPSRERWTGPRGSGVAAAKTGITTPARKWAPGHGVDLLTELG